MHCLIPCRLNIEKGKQAQGVGYDRDKSVDFGVKVMTPDGLELRNERRVE